MSVTGASAASSYALSQQVQSLTQHKHGRHPSISDVDLQSASAASTPGPSGKPGNKIDITA
jgi:hypothetical protein